MEETGPTRSTAAASYVAPKTRMESSDPLEALGPSLFLSIISYLPFPSILASDEVNRQWHQVIRSHSRTVWRAACHRTGVYEDRINGLESLEWATATTTQSETSEDRQERGVEGDTTNWKDLCRKYIEEDRNWRFGRPKERWITPEPRNVWRFKVDHEQGTVITTGTTGGLVVSDLQTGSPLFCLRQVSHYAHLEFAKGIVIFNSDHFAADGRLYVYRTKPSLARSNYPSPARNKVPRDALPCEATSGTQDDRGGLEFYRLIIPPTWCRAFRARVDYEGTPDERAVLCTAGSAGVFVWDLDDVNRVDTIPFDPTDHTDVNYVELDEEFIFLCSPSRMHVYSRRTKRKIVSFPDGTSDRLSGGFAVIPGDKEWTWLTRPDQQGKHPKVPVRQNVTGLSPGASWNAPRLQSIIRRFNAHPHMGLEQDRFHNVDFTACHYTTNSDLYCAADMGFLLVVRNYREVFRLADYHAILEVLDQQSLWLFYEKPICDLTTFGTKVVFSDGIDHHYYLDTSTLPTMPLRSDGCSYGHVRTFDITGPITGETVNCLQMCRSNIYLSCSLSARDRIRIDPESGEETILPFTPDQSDSVIRVWDITS